MTCKNCEIYQNAISINPLYQGCKHCWLNKRRLSVWGEDPVCENFRPGDKVSAPLTFTNYTTIISDNLKSN